ncbi:MAG: transcriptional regulator, DeoR family [Frankiales bacterium]|jgi:DeoR family fructose operon transcriptional repressor|nr:transcriptional regulator, DeoR family [Frankiales bacterium]
MYAEERQGEIARQARAQGRVDVAELALSFSVSLETVRRDLTALERSGVLRRVHGGAIPAERLRHEPGLAVRAGEHTEQKRRIAQAALAELEGAATVLLDAGSTTAQLADLLPVGRELTVVTNALPIATALSGRTDLTLHLLGGRVRPRTLATVDHVALAGLADLCVDVAFLGTNGISTERGLTTADPAEAAVKRAMVAAARRAVVLTDSSKVGDDQFARFAGLEDVETLVMDNAVDPRVAAAFEAAGPRVVLA